MNVEQQPQTLYQQISFLISCVIIVIIVISQQTIRVLGKCSKNNIITTGVFYDYSDWLKSLQTAMLAWMLQYQNP